MFTPPVLVAYWVFGLVAAGGLATGTVGSGSVNCRPGMNTRNIRCLTLALFAMLGFAFHIGIGRALETERTFSPAIPKTWDDQEMASLELPVADPAGSPVHVSADYYYRIPIRPIYKSYPVYAPGNEPAGYEEWLKQQEPETVFDVSKLKTEADWIKAGAVVFDAPTFYDVLVRSADVKDPLWHEKTGALPAKDGSLPYFRYVVREKGKIELGTISCAMCHTRVMPDGTVVKGAQGNFPFELAGVHFARQSFTPERLRHNLRRIRDWMASDSFLSTDPDRGQYDIRRLLLRSGWALRGGPGIFRVTGQGQRPAARPEKR
jgi:hypothetical protein